MALFIFFLLKGHDFLKDLRILSQAGIHNCPYTIMAEDPLAALVVLVGNPVGVIVPAHGVGLDAR